MKKIVLSLAGVLAAAAFAPEASALPVFARQTGMACSACHYQHFPLLNGFGRSFKANAYTMVGSEPMVEGEHLSIPDRLNMAVFTTTYWQNESMATDGVGPGTNSHWGAPSAGGELSIFFGGKVTDFAGFLSELGMTSTSVASVGATAANTAPPTTTNSTAGTNAAKLVVLFPVGDSRVGISSYSTAGGGAAYSFEYLNTGAVQTHKMMANTGVHSQHVAAAYASQYMGTNGNATGVHFVANNSMGFVNIGKYAAAGPGTGNANDLPLTYARAAFTFDMSGWDSAIGVQHFSGSQGAFGANAVNHANIIDAQAQGELGEMETGFYVSYAAAPANSAGNNLVAGNSALATATGFTNVNVGATSLNLATSVEIVPHTMTLQAAYRKASFKPNVGNSSDDNAFMLGATYELAMNMGLGLNYTSQSGSAWDNYAAANGGQDAVGKTMTTVVLETAF